MDKKSNRHLTVVKPPKDSMLKKIGKGIKTAGAAASSYLGLDNVEDSKPNCGTEGCNISEIHRHPTTKGFGPQMAGEVGTGTVGTGSALDDYMKAAQSTPEYQAILTRPEHFEVGATEHLPENVVSMQDFKDKKRFRKPEGY